MVRRALRMVERMVKPRIRLVHDRHRRETVNLPRRRWRTLDVARIRRGLGALILVCIGLSSSGRVTFISCLFFAWECLLVNLLRDGGPGREIAYQPRWRWLRVACIALVLGVQNLVCIVLLSSRRVTAVSSDFLGLGFLLLGIGFLLLAILVRDLGPDPDVPGVQNTIEGDNERAASSAGASTSYGTAGEQYPPEPEPEPKDQHDANPSRLRRSRHRGI